MTGGYSPLRRWLRAERARDNAEFTDVDGAPTVGYAWSFVDIAIVRAAYAGFIERKEAGGTRLLMGLHRTVRAARPLHGRRLMGATTMAPMAGRMFVFHRVRPKDVPKWTALGWQALPPRRGARGKATAEIRWFGALPYPVPAAAV